jgi:hypothetical protein
MRDRRRHWLAPTILLAVTLLAACGRAATDEGSPTSVPGAETLPPGAGDRCGDGVCDEAEQSDPSLCPQDCPTTEAPATATPLPAEDTPRPGAKCGDGVCDEIEQMDRSLCPQDCFEPTATPRRRPTPIPSTGEPDYEPPINVYLVLHIDPLGDQESEVFEPDQGMYERTRDEIDWLVGEAARHGLRFTALYNGWYPQWALQQGDTGQFRALLDAGHEIGSHAHRITYDAGEDVWVKRREELSILGRPFYDSEVARQCWEDAKRYVDAVLENIGAEGQNQTMCSTALTLAEEANLMDEFGFTIAAGNRLEKGIDYFGHVVWNPWRAANSDAPGYELAEDPSAGYITFNHLAQVGGGGSIGMPAESHGQDLTVPQMQRRFLMLYAEWLTQERRGVEDRVWSFGFVVHPNYGARHNTALTEFLDWLDEYFIGRTSPHGHTIARYATVGEIAEEFEAWETAHPGASSFDYRRGDPYPYAYGIVLAMLQDAGYEAHVDLAPDVSCFRFSRDDQPIYMIWDDLGTQTVDFSTVESGQVRITDVTGSARVEDASALTLTQAPLFVEPVQ